MQTTQIYSSCMCVCECACILTHTPTCFSDFISCYSPSISLSFLSIPLTNQACSNLRTTALPTPSAPRYPNGLFLHILQDTVTVYMYIWVLMYLPFPSLLCCPPQDLSSSNIVYIFLISLPLLEERLHEGCCLLYSCLYSQ